MHPVGLGHSIHLNIELGQSGKAVVNLGLGGLSRVVLPIERGILGAESEWQRPS